MANSTAKNLVRPLSVLLFCTLPLAWSQQVPDINLDETLPIALDADSSEFDRKNDRLLFHGLRITQGVLGIEADDAEATRLDFEESLWVFTGNVIIDSGDTRAYADKAEMLFQDHQLKSAIMRGSPARFEQKRLEADELTQGHSLVMEYDLETGVIRMSEDAWISDGANEVSGARITYDLVKEYITADADDSGQVRMKITPPDKDEP